MSTTVLDDDAAKPQATRLAAISICLLILVALIDSQVVAAITPQIAAGLGAAKTTVATSAAIYAVAAATVALLLGKSKRRIDPLSALPISAGIFVCANLFAVFAPHVWAFWSARAVAGLAGGLISALAIAALANASVYANRGKQMSGVAISYFLAPVVGVPAGTFIAGRFGWRAVFAATAVLVALAGLLVRQFPLSANENGLTGATPDAQATEQASGARQRKTSLWHLANQTRSARMGIISAFFVSGGLVGLTAFLGTWLSDAFRAGTGEIGAIYAIAGAGAVVGGALGGLLADRFGKRRIAVESSIVMAVLVLLLPTFNWSAVLWAIIGLTAFFAALRIAPLQALITELVAPTERATYVALRNGASQLGIASAVALGGRIYPSYGLAGIGVLCSALTIGAWLTMRGLVDPHEEERTSKIDEMQPHKRRRRLVRRFVAAVVALVLIVGAGLPWLLSFAITKAGTRPDERRRTDTPADMGATFENVTFASTDGNQLSGWYLPATTQTVTIIMTHGLFRSRYEMLDRGVALWREGYGVLLYDLRRHGQSAAEFSTIGYDERHDVLAAVKFVHERAPMNRIVLMGVSMGAAATLLAAPDAGDILAVIAESSFLSFTDTVWHHLSLGHIPTVPFAPLLVEFTAWRLNFKPTDFDVRKSVPKISCPILFIGGGADVRMPNATVLEPLYAAAKNPLKSKLIIADAKHGHAYDQDPNEYLQGINDFLQRVEKSEQRAP